MPKPFANSPRFSGTILENYIIGIQIGQATNDDGLDQMMYVTTAALRSFLRQGMASVYNYRGEYSSAAPTDLANGDAFYALNTFTDGGYTFVQGHLYAWNGSAWGDISNIFSQYAQQAEVDALESRVTDEEVSIVENKAKIVALENNLANLEEYIPSGFHYKGKDTYANIMALTTMAQGDMWYATDTEKYYAYNGTIWDDLPNLGLYWVANSDGDEELCIEI